MNISVQYVELYQVLAHRNCSVQLCSSLNGFTGVQADLSDLTTGKPVKLRDTGSDPFRFLLEVRDQRKAWFCCSALTV